MAQTTDLLPTIPAKKVRKKSPKRAVYKCEPMDFRAFIDSKEITTADTDFIAVSVTAGSYSIGYALVLSNLGVEDTEKKTVIHGILSDKNEYRRAINRLSVIKLVSTKLVEQINEYDYYRSTWSYKKFINENLPGSDAVCAALCTDNGFEFVLSDCHRLTRLSLGKINSAQDKKLAISRINVIVDAVHRLMQSIHDNYALNDKKDSEKD